MPQIERCTECNKPLRYQKGDNRAASLCEACDKRLMDAWERARGLASSEKEASLPRVTWARCTLCGTTIKIREGEERKELSEHLAGCSASGGKNKR